MKAVASAAALLLVFSTAPAPQPASPSVAPATRVDAFAAMQRLNAELLGSRSATATLESWCRDRRLAETPLIVANLVRGARKQPSAEQLRRLEVGSDREVAYRQVRLQCGTRVLSEADNWYVPARLTPEIDRLLNTTNVPFGRAVAPLEPSRRTIAVKLLWSDSDRPMPAAVFEHHALLYTRDGKPFSEVAETYRRELFDAVSFDAGAVAQREIRSARIAQNAAIASGDLDRAAAFWTEDVTVRRALGQALSGRVAARQALEPPAPPARRIVYQRLTADVNVGAPWPLAFETGTWEGHLDSIGGATVIGGRFSAQWVKRNDRWLIRSEVFVALTCSGIACEAAAVP